MPDNEEQTSFVDVHFDVTQEERIRSFLELFSPTYKGYLLDQTPTQMHTKEFIIRIYYEDHASITLTCYSPEMLQQRLQNMYNINNNVRFINRTPNIEKHAFSLTRLEGEEEVTIYYTATVAFAFIKS